MLLLNVLALTAATVVPEEVVKESAFTFGMNEAVALILFLAYVVCFGNVGFDFLRETTLKKEGWYKNPISIKISLISRGVIGGIVACYIIYRFVTWVIWDIGNATDTFAVILLPVIGAVVVIWLLTVIVLFMYFFICQPFNKLVSYLKKKE